MKKFPRTLYITRTDPDEFPDDVEYFVNESKTFVAGEEIDDTEVAVYQLVKVGSVKKISKIVFDD